MRKIIEAPGAGNVFTGEDFYRIFDDDDADADDNLMHKNHEIDYAEEQARGWKFTDASCLARDNYREDAHEMMCVQRLKETKPSWSEDLVLIEAVDKPAASPDAWHRGRIAC